MLKSEENGVGGENKINMNENVITPKTPITPNWLNMPITSISFDTTTISDTIKENLDNIYLPGNKIPLFDIEKVRNIKEEKIQEGVNKIEDEDKSESYKRLIILDQMNTSISSGSENENEYNEVEDNKQGIPNSFFFDDYKKKPISDISNSSTYQSSLYFPNQFGQNPPKLSDINTNYNNLQNYSNNMPVKDEKIQKEYKYPKLFEVEKGKYYYIYENKMETFYYAQNMRFGVKYSTNTNFITEENFIESLGLHFCFRRILLSETEIYECRPDIMFCKECMNKNKMRYNLEDKYLININGRPSKKRKNGFHCYGHYNMGNKTECCEDKFTCIACQWLNQYEKYYLSSG